MHERISIHPVCFPDIALHSLVGNWQKVGAGRVDLINGHLRDEGLPAVQAVIEAGRYKVESINHVFLPYGQYWEKNEESWRVPQANLSRLIEEAKALGARSIYMLTGGHGRLTWEESAECFSAAIAPCVAQAKAAGIQLLIEDAAPLYPDIHLAHSLRDTITLAELAGVGICIDFFACWTEAALQGSIKRAIPRCHLVQVCDYVYGDRSLPSRAVPGDGAIPVQRLIGWILDAGYQGAFDLELPGPRIEREGNVAAVIRAADKVGAILHSLGV
jgi:sugar phosphate isomerase/epimerase